MTKKKNIQPEQIHIRWVQVYKNMIDTPESFLNAPFYIKHYRHGIAQQPGMDLENELFRIRMDIAIDGLNENKEDTGVRGNFGIEIVFNIENLNQFISGEGNSFEIDGDFGAVIMGIVYSTARGIIFEKTRGSFLEKIILPVINPAELLNAKEIKEEQNS